MTTYLVTFFISLIVCALVTPLVLTLAQKRRWYDMPSERKVHREPTPRVGGLAIVLAFFAPITGLLLVDSGVGDTFKAVTEHVIGLYLGGLAIAALGFYDDIRGANATQKLVIQIGIAVMMFFLGFRIDIVSNPFGEAIDVGILALPLTVLWFVGVINAVNLIDGLDGLAGGIALIAVTALAVIALLGDNQIPALFCCGLGGALAGFLFYNFNPARIFMGDTGSMFVGFVLASLSITATLKGPTTVAILVPLLALGVPTLDTLMAMGRRIRAKRPLFQADREHLHHRLLKTGLSTRQTVLALYGVATLFALSAITMRVTTNLGAGLVLLAVALLTFVLLRFLTQHQLSEPSSWTEASIASGREHVRTFADQLATCTSAEAIIEAIEALALQCPAGRVLVCVSDNRSLIFEADSAEPTSDLYEIPLEDNQGHSQASLQVGLLMTNSEEALAAIVPWELAAFVLAQRLEALEWKPLPGLVSQQHSDETVGVAKIIRLPGRFDASDLRPSTATAHSKR